MFTSAESAITLALTYLLAAVAHAQNVGFTQYPNQVVTGLSYPVSWEAGGASVTINLLENGAVGDTLYNGAGTAFTWIVDDDDNDAGTGYALQLTVQGSALPITSGAIWVIEEDDGLFVNGQQIFASIAGGPASAGLVMPASSVVASASTLPPEATTTASVNPTSTTRAGSVVAVDVRTATATFTSAQSIYTFTTTVSASSAMGSNELIETLTFISNGLSFTTTLVASATGSVATAADQAASSVRGNGLSGGVIAGIVVGVFAVFLLVLGFLWFCRRRQRSRRAAGNTTKSPILAFISGGRQALSNRKSVDATLPTALGENEKTVQRQSLVSPLSPNAPSEIEGSIPPVGAIYNGSTLRSSELDGGARYEMNAAPPTYELAGEDVPADRGDNTRYPATCVSISPTNASIHPGSVVSGPTM